MSEKIELTSEIGVSLIDSMGSDESVVHAARVSVVGARAETEEGERSGLLAFLMNNRHTSPFEHVTATFMVEVPLFVRSEWHRHRTQSYNEVSGRYSVMKPKFYVPHVDRPLVQIGKPGAYSFQVGSMEEWQSSKNRQERVFQVAWQTYQAELAAGVAKEVARNVLPLSLYTAFYATANLLNWLRFLSLRTDPSALMEIREAAFKIEQNLYQIAPITMELWDKAGRRI